MFHLSNLRCQSAISECFGTSVHLLILEDDAFTLLRALQSGEKTLARISGELHLNAPSWDFHAHHRSPVCDWQRMICAPMSINLSTNPNKGFKHLLLMRPLSFEFIFPLRWCSINPVFNPGCKCIIYGHTEPSKSCDFIQFLCRDTRSSFSDRILHQFFKGRTTPGLVDTFLFSLLIGSSQRGRMKLLILSYPVRWYGVAPDNFVTLFYRQ